jgi:hypothetical protein
MVATYAALFGFDVTAESGLYGDSGDSCAQTEMSKEDLVDVKASDELKIY